MVEFTIIIPVYNAEKTLERCLHSIEMQTFSNYEVILIDDGSKDDSFNICKEYEMKDNRYRVIHQANSGPSAARNVGLDEARGNWVCFIDSDDSVDEEYLNEIYSVIQDKKIDVVFLGHFKVYKNKKIESCIPNNVYQEKMDTVIELSKSDMFGYTWIKCFKREVIKNNRFDSTLNLFEDEVFTCQVIANCEKIGVVQKPIYNYYIGDGNTLIGRTYNDYCVKCDKVFKAWEEMLKNLPEKDDILMEKANTFVSRSYYYAFEREIDINTYFSCLKDSEYFQKHTEKYKYDDLVRNDKYTKLHLEKVKYLTKVKIHEMINGR